jgi:hypothetical protein
MDTAMVRYANAIRPAVQIRRSLGRSLHATYDNTFYYRRRKVQATPLTGSVFWQLAFQWTPRFDN